MSKVQRITGFQSFSLFFLFQNSEKVNSAFLKSDLGKMYQAIPWERMTKVCELKEKKKEEKPSFLLRENRSYVFESI